jgi:alkylhydroperoxidase family enzyme
MLMHAPTALDGWQRLGRAIDADLHVDDRSRELVICAVLAACGGRYEWRHHAATALRHGVTEAELDALQTGDRSIFSAGDLALMDLVDVVGRDPGAAGSTLDALGDAFDDRQRCELVMIIGFYWMVTRVSLGLAVELDP